jgi:hypothetical protein
MWRSRNNRDGTTVVCIACGTSLPRAEAREYDKLGNRWERHGKSFEHLCKECYRELCHQPRDELEALLVDVERAVDPDTDADPDRGYDVETPDGDPAAGAESGTNLPVDPDSVSEAGAGGEREDGADEGRDTGADEEDDVGDDDRTFIAEYFRAVEEWYGPAEEPGHES